MTRAASDAAHLCSLANMHDHRASVMGRLHGPRSWQAADARKDADALRAAAEKARKTK